MIDINIHVLQGDESGFAASNQRPIKPFGYREGKGDTKEEAIESLAHALNVEVSELEVAYDEAAQNVPQWIVDEQNGEAWVEDDEDDFQAIGSYEVNGPDMVQPEF